MKRCPAAVLLVTILLIIAGCSRGPVVERIWSRENALVPASSLPEISTDGQREGLIQAAERSVQYLSRGTSTLQFGTVTVERRAMASAIRELLLFLKSSPSDAALSHYLTDHFELFKSGADTVLFTGYYSPLLRGSRHQSTRYAYPLYRKPDDLVSVQLSDSIKTKLTPDIPVINRGRLQKGVVTVPYYSREEIESGILKNRDLEILWVDDPIDLFFLHIQGSGIVELDDGSRVYVGYEDKNGQPYVAVGKTMIDRGLLQKGAVNMFSIKNRLRQSPASAAEILNQNPSYCFFKILNSPPVGSIGVPVTGEHSIATDSSLFPPGVPALIQTSIPEFNEAGEVIGSQPITKLVFNQDTGGAIRGAGRVDLYFGEGPLAERRAGLMQQQGMLYLLAPRKQ